MKFEGNQRRFDFHDIELAIKRAREASGMSQKQLIVDRVPMPLCIMRMTLSIPAAG